MTRTSVPNLAATTLPLALEPWGEDYWLAPGESVEVVAEQPDAESIEVVREANAIIVYVTGSSEVVRVECDGEVLLCGRGRPAGWKG